MIRIQPVDPMTGDSCTVKSVIEKIKIDGGAIGYNAEDEDFE